MRQRLKRWRAALVARAKSRKTWIAVGLSLVGPIVEARWDLADRANSVLDRWAIPVVSEVGRFLVRLFLNGGWVLVAVVAVILVLAYFDARRTGPVGGVTVRVTDRGTASVVADPGVPVRVAPRPLATRSGFPTSAAPESEASGPLPDPISRDSGLGAVGRFVAADEAMRLRSFLIEQMKAGEQFVDVFHRLVDVQIGTATPDIGEWYRTVYYRLLESRPHLASQFGAPTGSRGVAEIKRRLEALEGIVLALTKEGDAPLL